MDRSRLYTKIDDSLMALAGLNDPRLENVPKDLKERALGALDAILEAMKPLVIHDSLKAYRNFRHNTDQSYDLDDMLADVNASLVQGIYGYRPGASKYAAASYLRGIIWATTLNRHLYRSRKCRIPAMKRVSLDCKLDPGDQSFLDCLAEATQPEPSPIDPTLTALENFLKGKTVKGRVRLEEVVPLFREGHNVSSVAKRLGIGRQTLNWHLKAFRKQYLKE